MINPIVIFEGLDKSGKTTLYRALEKRTNYGKFITQDRGPAGYCVFDEVIRQNNSSYDDWYNSAKALSFATCIIYCKVDFNIALQRIKEHNEICPYNYKEAQIIYDKRIKEFYDSNKILIVDTSKPLEKCLQEIEFFIDNIRQTISKRKSN